MKEALRYVRRGLMVTVLIHVTTALAHSAPSSLTVPFSAEDPRFHAFIEAPVTLEVLAEDLSWGEGPLWVPSLDALLFSDLAEDVVYRWDSVAGLRPYLHPSGHAPDGAGHAWRGANGLAIDARGRLLLAQQSARRVARMDSPIDAPESEFVTLASAFDDLRLNSPNDLVVSESGDIYFSDPPYGLAGFEKSDQIELPFFGVFRLSARGEMIPLITHLEKPNGLALSPDQSTLFVSDSQEEQPAIYRLSLAHHEEPGEAELFFDASSLIDQGPGSTDGLAVHSSGTVFASVPGGLVLLSSRGELLGRLRLGQVTNVAFDPCECALFVTTPTQLLRLPLQSGT